MLNFLDSLRALVFIKVGAYYSRRIYFAQLALMNALAQMIQLVVFCFIIITSYSAFAVKLQKGSLYSCTGLDAEILVLVVT